MVHTPCLPHAVDSTHEWVEQKARLTLSQHGSLSIDWPSFFVVLRTSSNLPLRGFKGRENKDNSAWPSSLWSASKVELWTIATWNSFSCLFDLSWHKHANTTYTALLADTSALWLTGSDEQKRDRKRKGAVFWKKCCSISSRDGKKRSLGTKMTFFVAILECQHIV